MNVELDMIGFKCVGGGQEEYALCGYKSRLYISSPSDLRLFGLDLRLPVFLQLTLYHMRHVHITLPRCYEIAVTDLSPKTNHV